MQQIQPMMFVFVPALYSALNIVLSILLGKFTFEKSMDCILDMFLVSAMLFMIQQQI